MYTSVRARTPKIPVADQIFIRYTPCLGTVSVLKNDGNVCLHLAWVADMPNVNMMISIDSAKSPAGALPADGLAFLQGILGHKVRGIHRWLRSPYMASNAELICFCWSEKTVEQVVEFNSQWFEAAWLLFSEQEAIFLFHISNFIISLFTKPVNTTLFKSKLTKNLYIPALETCNWY